jgi:DNA adenine methylase
MILKWPGGKKWLLTKAYDLIPTKINNYIEPFIGGGSFFFAIATKQSLLPATISQGILSDTNEKLIMFYKALQKNPNKLFEEGIALINQHSEKFYYQIREEFNQDYAPHKFIYLNRTCFNGVYRENNSGAFNVPVGRRKKIAFPTKQYFVECANNLKDFEVTSCDFSETLMKAKKGDFIYLDPPYVDRPYESNAYKTFRKYNAKEFSIEDLERMVEICNQLKGKCSILISNFSVDLVKDYFKKTDGWHFRETEKTTFISGKAKGRTKVKEAIIYNKI